MKLVCLGDSLTYGYRIRPDKVWTNQLAKEIGIEVINKGVNGDITRGMVKRFYADVVRHKPTHTLILGGANDIILEISIEEIKENITKMVKIALDEGIIPLLGVTMEMDGEMASKEWADGTDYDKANENVILLRDWILDYCEKNNLIGIDFFKSYHEALKEAVSASCFLDGLHPTESGQEILKNTVKKSLRRE